MIILDPTPYHSMRISRATNRPDLPQPFEPYVQGHNHISLLLALGGGDRLVQEPFEFDLTSVVDLL